MSFSSILMIQISLIYSLKFVSINLLNSIWQLCDLITQSGNVLLSQCPSERAESEPSTWMPETPAAPLSVLRHGGCLWAQLGPCLAQ